MGAWAVGTWKGEGKGEGREGVGGNGKWDGEGEGIRGRRGEGRGREGGKREGRREGEGRALCPCTPRQKSAPMTLTEDETITKEPRQLHNENLDLLIYIFWIHLKSSRILFCGLCLLCFKVEMFTFK
jgi:hypothetical protein